MAHQSAEKKCKEKPTIRAISGETKLRGRGIAFKGEKGNFKATGKKRRGRRKNSKRSEIGGVGKTECSAASKVYLYEPPRREKNLRTKRKKKTDRGGGGKDRGS